MIDDMSSSCLIITDLMISWHTSMISASDDGPRRKIGTSGIPRIFRSPKPGSIIGSRVREVWMRIQTNHRCFFMSSA